MKEKLKNLSIIVLLVVLIICVIAYVKKGMDYDNLESRIAQLTSEKQEIIDAKKDSEKESKVNNNSQIRAKKLDVEKMNKYTLIDEYQINVDDDVAIEIVELYADIEVINGSYAWDDGQRWLLQVRDGDQGYVIFDDYIQLGVMEAYVYEDLTENSVHITTVLKAGAGIIIKDFIFDKKDKIFYEEQVLYKSNINNLRTLSIN